MLLRATAATVLLLITGLASACAKDSTNPPSPTAAPVGPATVAAEPPELVNGLAQIEDPSLVCMVTNMYMGKAQIPVEVEGKTYFGCCEMCKARLANEPDTRTAVDPVTGEPVDKATAVIARDADGSVHYFASQQSLRAYR